MLVLIAIPAMRVAVCVLSFYLGGLWILYSQFFYYIHSTLTGHEYLHVTSHKPTSVRDNPWYIKAAGRARLILVSSPDPTYEREGLVTSSRYLGLH